MSDTNAATLPEVAVITMRSEPTPQNATYHLLNVLAELTAVSLVTVALSDDSKIPGDHDVTEISSGSKVGSLPRMMLRFVGNQLRLCNQIRTTEADVVYFFGGTAYVLPMVVAKLLGKTVIVQPRGDVPLTLELEWREQFPDVVAGVLAGIVRSFEFVGYTVADRIVTYTESMAEELNLSRFGDKVYPRGTRYIDVDQFTPSVPYSERDRRVGMIGRLDVEKGIEPLAGAVRALPDDVEFTFVGDGSRREWLERELADDTESGRVEVAGWVDHDEVPEHLNRIRLLVMASEPTEGLPTAIQEAFACGTPVYAPPVAGIPDVVRDGETGFLMEDRDPERIASDIVSILDREDLDAVSENCREFAAENYSFDASVERFRTLLSAV